ncbi:cytochrome P450 [Natrarchaeobius chitinivorans]|uniref:Cytochrome P450 n=1 Tax=Natrarchaeobius chitinivorans TaxID=1679083 RepID=A0A3N6MFN1_NATCH|nr:cytochrome P450 [Natrarchaeobius chitinivorans]RQG94391.1 cytochrome P450 [Natrarchaeobius chitinivorans]
MTPQRSTPGNGSGGGNDGSLGDEVADGESDANGQSPTERRDWPLEAYPLPPGPDGLPIVGNTFQVVRDPIGFYDVVSRYGDVVRYRVAGKTFTALLHPDHVERVLVSEHDRFERYLFTEFGLDIGSEGLLTSTGEQWHRQRQLMQPAFTIERIRTYADTMAAYAERTADDWDDGQTIAANRAFSRLTLGILAKALFDVEIDPESDDEVIVRAARAINERANTQSVFTFLPKWLPTPENRRYDRAMADYRERIDELIHHRRSDGPGGDDLLSLLLEASGPEGADLSPEEVRDNLVTFLFAGHETSSVALTYTFMLLARHDDVADTLHEELETVLDGERPRFEHVPRLEYTEHVITEAMRLYPPAYILFRTVLEDVVIDGYRIPEGTIVTLPQFWLHTDERFYDDPDAFEPERWTDDRDRPEYAYFPFGGGPRHCIGMRFAMLEMKLIVATLMQQFEPTLLSEPDPEPAVTTTLKPAEDVLIRMDRR